MIHLIKLAVGIRDIEHLAEVQRARGLADPPLRHRTRQMPKRQAEILDGGSIYWVIAGLVQCRQQLLGLETEERADGTKGTALILDPRLVTVEPRPTRAFQGWRYLRQEEAPPDLSENAEGGRDLPSGLRMTLRELCLL